MNITDIELDIRNKIIMPFGTSKSFTSYFSNCELAAIYSKNNNNFRIFKLLLKCNYIETLNETFRIIVRFTGTTASIDAVKLLISYGVNINNKDDTNRTPLMDAMQFLYLNDRISIETINLLFEHGADVNIKSNTGKIALSYAINNSYTLENLEIIKLLVRKGSNINNKDWKYNTPLIKCFNSRSNTLIKYKTIKLLLDNKADIYIKNKKGEVILNLVKKNIHCNTDIYSLIFNYKNIKNDHLCECDINFIYI